MKVSLGTALWGWSIEKGECFRLLDFFYQKGFREVDTARNYPMNARSEDMGRALSFLHEWTSAHQVTDLRVTCKVGSVHNLGTPELDLSAVGLEEVFRSVQGLLGGNLSTVMVHWDSRESFPMIYETVQALLKIKDEVRIGLSGIARPELYLAAGLTDLIDIQVKVNLFESTLERYLPTWPRARYFAYGVNAKGLNWDQNYHPQSSVVLRKGDWEGQRQRLERIRDSVARRQLTSVIKNFNDLNLLYVSQIPEIQGVILGPSKMAHLINSVETLDRIQNQREFFPQCYPLDQFLI